MHNEETAPPRVILPRRRRLAEIPSGNPLKNILERELLGRVAQRKRHGRKHAVTVDYFCGAGGLTSGVERARERLGVPGYHYGINHDEYAIQTISNNHHGTFVNSSVESIPVREIVREGYVTLFTGAAECFPGETLVLTDRGYRQIADVIPGDAVLTHKGRWRKVEAKMRKRDATIVVKGRGHFGLETTADHPFWIKQRGRKWNNERRCYDSTFSEPSWLNASSLTRKSFWATPVLVDPPSGSVL